MDILAFQLEPALALTRGHAFRFLLADEVGLGKTVQAGLMIAELQHRGWCEHALVLTPAGLRHQWADELSRRFGIQAALIDAAALASCGASLPPDVNPWSAPTVVIASIDFVKQPEVLLGVAGVIWDILIVDEAHQASPHSIRYDAVRTLALRARHVVLVSATPHQGDDAAYRALCGLGETDPTDQILLFRRTRQQAGLPRTRRAHLLPVKPGSEALDMHRRVDSYVARLWRLAASGRREVQLAAMVLAKRALSSAHALAITAERRLEGLTTSNDSQAQKPLPFEDEAEDDQQVPLVAAFESIAEEQEVLKGIVRAAQRAQTAERKLHVLQKLLRRVHEPAIVFTEYRDTLDAIVSAINALRVVATLHGGQNPAERIESIRRFTTGEANLLVATDAGSEGLNLQSNCRLVINLELPWNPTRLEQRIGRVDRVGQTRTVHAVNLFADGTSEGEVLAALLRRLDRIRMSDIQVAACVFNRQLPPCDLEPAESCTSTIDLSSTARAEAARIVHFRGSRPTTIGPECNDVPVCVIRRSPSMILFLRIRLVTRSGRLAEEMMVPVHVPLRKFGRPVRRRDVRGLATHLVTDLGPVAIDLARQAGVQRARAIGDDSAGWLRRALNRERHLARLSEANVAPLIQAGLFDNRVLIERRQAWRHREACDRAHEDHSAGLEGSAEIVLAQDPEVALLLLSC